MKDHERGCFQNSFSIESSKFITFNISIGITKAGPFLSKFALARLLEASPCTSKFTYALPMMEFILGFLLFCCEVVGQLMVFTFLIRDLSESTS